MKTALVLGGGGSRGSYQIGVWQALRELGIRVNIVTGSSVGALNGAMVVQGNFETAVAVWKELDISAVFDLEGKATLAAYAKEFFKQGGLSANGLAQLLNQYLDEAAIRLSPIDFGLVTVKKKGLVPCPIYLEDIPDRQLIDYLLASAACYPVVKSHPILEDEYIDGGYYDNLPIDLAKEKGAEAIIAVNLDAVGMLQSSLKELKRDPNTVYISPSWDLGNFLMFEKETAKRNIRLGYLDAMKAYGFFDGTAYTFQKQDFPRFAKQKSVTVRTWKELFQEARRSGNLIRSVGCNALKNYLSSQTKKPLIPSVILETAAQTAGRILEVDPLLLYTVDRFHEALSQKAQLLSQEKELAALLQSSAQKSISPKAKWLKSLDTKGITLCLAALFQSKAELWFPFAPIFPKETVAALYLAAFGIFPS